MDLRENAEFDIKLVFLVECFMSQSTAMVRLGWLVHLTIFFPGEA